MRLISCSDAHLDAVSHGVQRFDEIAGALMQSVDYAIGKRADCWFFLGDVMDPDSGQVVFRCVEVMINAALKLNSAGIPAVFLVGNHDVGSCGDGTTTLSPLRALTTDNDGIYVIDEPRVFRPKGLFSLCALPFTEPSRTYDPEKVIPDEGVDVTIGHLNLPGIIVGSEAEMVRGRDVMFPVEKACAKSRLVLHGHYHQRQRTPEGIWIPGSLARLTFGEEDNIPSFLDLELP